MLNMVSYSHRLQSGHFICSFNRTFDVLTTGLTPSLDSSPLRQHNAYTFFLRTWKLRLFGSTSKKKRGGNVERLKGTVKWFNNAKGYGFLGRDDGPDVFIHYSSITTEGYKSLQEGDQVEFEIVQGQKGPQAANVTKTA
jgi:CspA family cold shock protein